MLLSRWLFGTGIQQRVNKRRAVRVEFQLMFSKNDVPIKVMFTLLKSGR
jgi:hypothetical protein